MINVVIIDDERLSRDLLRKMLTDFCEGIQVIGEANGVTAGIELLHSKQPDIILLDIEMADGDGFDILNAIDYTQSKVIFVTGYDQYAIKAIKYAALDYLLKPVDLEELQEAIQKLGKHKTDERAKLQFLHSQYKNREDEIQEIVLPGRNGFTVVELDQIIRIEAQGSYVVIYLEDEKSHVVVHPLSHYEALLPTQKFFRIHKSHLINIQKIKHFTPGRSGIVQLKDDSQLPIAARRISAFKQLFLRS